MNIITKIIFGAVILFMTAPVFSQTTDSDVPTLPEILKSSRFDGVIKTKLETSAETGMMRFNVRNSRVGVRGDIGEYLSYRMQMELSNEGRFEPLDLFGTMKPTKNLSFSFGQQNIPFDNNYIIAPGEMMFANRTFLGKYFSSGTRDIGAVAQYRLNIDGFPIEGQMGMFNGGSINTPRWTDRPSLAFRMIVGSMSGFRSSAKIYRYSNEYSNRDMLLWGADVRYSNSRLRIETEMMKRNSKNTEIVSDLFGAYIQGTYQFDLPNPHGMFRYLTPAARLDAMGYDVRKSGFDVTRFTCGLQFGLTFMPFDSLLRIDYEQYFLRKNINFPTLVKPNFDSPRDDYATDNKVTVELIVRF